MVTKEKINNFFLNAEKKSLGKALKIEEIPKIHLPAFFLAGRSNVGKSTLINKLLYKKSLLRTSKSPGCTIHLHFEQLGEQMIIVDSPGYGYAKAYTLSDKWLQLIDYYWTNYAHNLVLIILLIDSRRGLQEMDHELIQMAANYNLKVQLVFTKVDKKASHEILQKQHTQLNIPNLSSNIIYCSANKNYGFDELRYLIWEESAKFLKDTKNNFFYKKI